MKIYVIRHGKTPLNKAGKVNGQIDEPLSPEGVGETKTTIPSIPDSVKHIYSSSMLRTKQTAEIISDTLHISYSLHDELREIAMGTLAGKSWEEMDQGDELKRKHRSVVFDYSPYGGESVKDVKSRILNFFKKINGKYADYEALIITHGGIIRVLQFLEHGQPNYDTKKPGKLITLNVDKILKNF